MNSPYLYFISLALITFGIICSILSLYSALPIFYQAMWSQSEQVVEGIYLSSSLCALGLIIYAINKERLSMLVLNFFHPFAFSFFLLALYSAVTSIFHDVPMRGFYGSAELGEGVFLFLALSIITTATITIFPHKKLRIAVGITAIVSAILAGSLNFLHQNVYNWPLTLYYYPDYISFFAIFASAILVCFFKELGKIRYALAIILYVLLTISSDNNAAKLLSILIIPFVVIAYYIKPLQTRWHTLSLTTIIAAPLIITISVYILGKLLGYKHDETIITMFGDHASHILTMLSRFYMLPIALEAMTAEPVSFIIGKGWASFGAQQVAYFPTEYIDIIGDGGPEWEGIWRDHFHSHNMFIDALLAAGIPGLIIFSAPIVLMPFFAKENIKILATCFALLYGTLAALWFQMPVSYPLLAISLASMAKPLTNLELYSKTLALKTASFKRIAILTLILSIPTLVFAATSAYSLTKKSFGFVAPQFISWDNCPDLIYDYERGGLHLAKYYKLTSSRIMDTIPEIRIVLDNEEIKKKRKQEIKNNQKITEFIKEKAEKEGSKISLDSFLRLKYSFCTVNNYIDNGHPSLRLRLIDLLVRTDIILTMLPHLPEGENADFAFVNWEKRITSFIKDAPKRTDQAIPYMIYHLNTGNEKKVENMANFLLNINGNDPGGLWFKGVVLLNYPQYSHIGLILMKQALKNGIARQIPINKEIYNMVMNSD